MEPNEKNLTPTEWHLMECLWEHAPRTGREAAEYMAKSQGWSRSTTLTLLRRMSAKGFIDCYEENGVNVYAPLILCSHRHSIKCHSVGVRFFSLGSI